MVLFLAPSAIGEIGHYIGYREENRHRTMVALLLSAWRLPAAHRARPVRQSSDAHGEPYPVEKHVADLAAPSRSRAAVNFVFMGTSVISGTATP